MTLATRARTPVRVRALRSKGPFLRRLLVVVTLTAIALAAGRMSTVTLARFTDPAVVGSNVFSTATLQPPAGPGAVAACNGLNTAKITVSWTAATYADGYEISRATTNGGPYSVIATVGVSTSYVNTGLATNTTYYYVVKTTRNAWRSGYSAQTQATTPLVCVL